MESRQTHCLIVGGGPAGMMLGFLLARTGIPVVVLEKHADFFRDFRGDTIHPSTLEIMHELGLLVEFLKIPHQQVREMGGFFNGHFAKIGDFTHLPTHCKFIAFMPQWDFLNFIASEAKRFAGFELLMEHEVVDLVFDGTRVAGVRAKTPAGEVEFGADLVVACDGRSSTVRDRAGLVVHEIGVAIDVLWMRISKGGKDPGQTLGFFRGGKLAVLLDRGNYWQCGYIIPKGTFEDIKSRPISEFQEKLVNMAGFLGDRVNELDDWSKIKLLTVQINRLEKWYRDGLLCVGDAAHAMSPAGGVGINLAIQDAVATANLLAEKLRRGDLTTGDLERVQRRREWPARLIQRLQAFIHRRIVTGWQSSDSTRLPIVPRMMKTFPVLRRLPAGFIGIGPRPEHVKKL